MTIYVRVLRNFFPGAGMVILEYRRWMELKGDRCMSIIFIISVDYSFTILASHS